MPDVYAKCGANCGRCPAFRENVKTAEAGRRCCEGWQKYLGFRTTPGRCYCDGCQTPDEENPVLLNPRCNVRKCGMFNVVETCAHCSAYACEYLSQDVSRERIEARLGAPMPEEDYLVFIEPYEGLKHLGEIRASLKSDNIVDPKVPVAKPRIADFPDDLSFSQEETSAFEALHKVLATVKNALSSGGTFIEQEVFKERRQWIFKFLWVSGLFGELREDDGSHLAVDSETFSVQKIPYWMDLEIVGRYLKILREYGVHCEHVPVTSEWLTPRGHLQKKGWFMKMSFDENAGGVSALKALKSYAIRLDEKYGEKAFRYFSNVDMRVLTEE